ncbi:MAG: AAA family ATPase [Clostridia bacterium]|nr:AAA family ATPase [Clostridia bacterium]
MEGFSLEVGQSIQIRADSSLGCNSYESKILSVGKETMEISAPHIQGIQVPYQSWLKVNLKTDTVRGAFEFPTKIISGNHINKSLVVSIPSDVLTRFESFVKGKRCKFITVISGKGGTGKTSFIINFAISLSKRGKRVALVDADLGMANIDLLMKVSPIYGIFDTLKGVKTFEDIMIDAPGGVKLIPGGSGRREFLNLTSQQFEKVLNNFEQLKDKFDYVLIDTSAGISNMLIDFIFMSQETIIVTTPEPHAVSDAFSVLRVLIPSNRNINVKLVVNRCENNQEAETVINRISGISKSFPNCRVTPLGFIPESKMVSRSIKEQVPLCIAYPEEEAAISIEEIADAELGLPKKARPKPPVEEIPVEDKNIIPANFVKKFKGFFGKGI